jgi:hypothetical protein
MSGGKQIKMQRESKWKQLPSHLCLFCLFFLAPQPSLLAPPLSLSLPHTNPLPPSHLVSLALALAPALTIPLVLVFIHAYEYARKSGGGQRARRRKRVPQDVLNFVLFFFLFSFSFSGVGRARTKRARRRERAHRGAQKPDSGAKQGSLYRPTGAFEGILFPPPLGP